MKGFFSFPPSCTAEGEPLRSGNYKEEGAEEHQETFLEIPGSCRHWELEQHLPDPKEPYQCNPEAAEYDVDPPEKSHRTVNTIGERGSAGQEVVLDFN